MTANGWFFAADPLSVAQGLELFLTGLCVLGSLTQRRLVRERVAALYVLVGIINIIAVLNSTQ